MTSRRSPYARRRFGALLAVAPLCMAPATGLDRAFPQPAGEAPTPQRVELGRLLFFDPVLSGDGSVSCAHCHRPDRGLADGLARGRGRGGAPLARNVPTLYNVAFKQRLFWDARAESLEAQVSGPLFSPQEMGAQQETLLQQLRDNAEYRARFAQAFSGDAEAVSIENLARALAAFERTLVATNSRYDRYARGERNALSAAERRGLSLFRSLNTRCFECHRLPTFDAPLTVGIGVPSQDGGVGAWNGNPGQLGFFSVPTLRNVALTAPYMHNGSLTTLEEVVDFYRRGGGRALDVDARSIDGQVRAFEISEQEAKDLVAFLRALTDESRRPTVPDAVPSGLPVLRFEPQSRSAENRALEVEDGA